MTEYAPGVPMWVDVSSTDMEKTRAFYSGLFGWEAQAIPDPQAGGYTMFLKDGKMVGAAGPVADPNAPPAWSTYVKTEDADATTQAVREAGGQVVAGPMDVMGQGRMAVFTDPTGAYIAVWQPQIHTGAEVVNEPDSFCWNELYTRDMPAAQEFYRRVFGWDPQDGPFAGGTYTQFQVDGRSIAGGMDMTTMLDASVPPHWLVYFAVRNTEEIVARVKELGGTVVSGPMDTPMGAMAVLQDPVGAYFAVIQAGSPN